MGKKDTSLFICKSCGNEFTKWQGQCTYCGEWNSLKELTNSQLRASPGNGSRRNVAPLRSGSREPSQPLLLSQIQSQTVTRFSTGFDELDRVFGGSLTPGVKDTKHPVFSQSSDVRRQMLDVQKGIVPGSVTLLSGEPGMGKSTLLSQLALKLAQGNIKNQKASDKLKLKNENRKLKKSQLSTLNSQFSNSVLYVCGEESPDQVKLRLDRLSEKLETRNLKLETISLLPETNLETIIDHLLKHPDKYQLVIIDSIQSLTSDQLPGFAGSVSQVRECGFQLTQVLKQTCTAGVLVGHVTKDGTLAGPKTLEHMVDAVLRLEGESTHDLRLVRSVKNRFGTTDEVGVFRMTGHGLIEVNNPGDVFLENSQQGQPGSVTTAVLEGNRVMLLEIQALVLKSNLAMPRRVANGVRLRRLQMILAVLQKQLNLNLGETDVFVNVAGGIHIDEPAADLAMALAVVSSLKNKAVGAPLVGAQALADTQYRAGTRPTPSPPTKQLNNNTSQQPSTVVFGELGLLGEIRPVVGAEKRIQQAKKLGYAKIIGVEEKHIKEIKI